LFWEALQGTLRKKDVVEVCPHMMALHMSDLYSVVVYAGHVVTLTFGTTNVLVHGVVQASCDPVGPVVFLSDTNSTHSLALYCSPNFLLFGSILLSVPSR
jgi:hypothetical protein